MQIRHEIIASAHEQAHLNRQTPLGTMPGNHFSNPSTWEEIAHRIEEEGHTPAY